MFNFSGSEIIFLLLLALIVLGPEKLPDAVRKFGKGYAEFKKVTTGFQEELKSALDEPVREMRETADLFKKAATFELDPHAPPPAASGQQTGTAPQAAVSSAQPDGAAPPIAPAPVPTTNPSGHAGGAVDDRFPAAGDEPTTASPHGDDLGASAG